MNRRELLKKAGAGAALFGAGAAVPSAQAASRAETTYTNGLPMKWDETYDVVVVGAGGAGMAAAVKAADQGSKVVILERLAFPGGNTHLAQGQINAADPVRQPRQGIKDSPELHAKQTLEAGDFRGNPDRVRVLWENAYGAITWLESLGMKFEKNVRCLAACTRERISRKCRKEKAIRLCFSRPWPNAKCRSSRTCA